MRHHSKRILYLSLLLIFTLGIFAGLSSAAAVWSSIDGDAATGINLNPSQEALQPALSFYQGELYAAWTETNGAAGQIRVKKYSGESWSFVDGGEAAGLNSDSASNASHPALAVYNDCLVIAWQEMTGSGSAIRVRKYDGNFWSWIDEGALNYSTEATVGAPALLVTGGALYVTWVETAPEGKGQIRVKKYDGSLWSFMDGGGNMGLNYNSIESAANPQLTVFNGSLYAAWEEYSGGISQIRVKKYFNTGSWAFVDGGGAVGLNWNPALNAGRPQLMECKGALYATWEEQNFYNANYKCIRFKKYDGTTWTFAASGSSAGINKNPTSDAKSPALVTSGSYLYLTWTEGDFSNGIPQIRAASSYNGGCAFIDGNLQTGLNKNVYTPAETPAITANATDLYLAWSEKFGNASQIRVKKLPLPARVTSVILPANGTYGPGQTLDFTVNFSKPVNIGNSPPTLQLTLDTGGVVQAAYVSGTGTNALSFRYTVQSGNQDTTGITVNLLFSGMPPLGDADNYADCILNGMGSTAGILVDGVGPKVLTGVQPANGTYIPGQNLDFTINFDEPVFVDITGGTPYISIGFDTGGGANMVVVKAFYISGSGTNSMKFRYTVKAGDLDTNGITNSGFTINANGATIRDVFGNNANLTLYGMPPAPGILVDGVAPTVSRVMLGLPSNNYTAGRNMDLVLTFTEAITVNTSAGTPYIPVTFDSGSANASYLSGSGTTNLTFRYTIQPGDLDQNGVVFGPSINLNGGTLRDPATNDAVLTLNNLFGMTGILVDAIAPTIVSVSAPPDGIYNYFPPTNPGNKVFTVYFSEPVKVTMTSGKPYFPIYLDSGGTLRAWYYSGAGSNALQFCIDMVPPGSLDLTGITVGTTIVLNGGTITDNATNNAVLTLNNVAGTAGILVDNCPSTVTSVTAPNGIYLAGQNLDLTVHFNEPVTVNTSAGTPYLRLLFDSPSSQPNASYVSGSGTSDLVFRYPIKTGDLDSNGIVVPTSITANGGVIRDIATNTAVLTLNNVGDMSGVLVDALIPKIAGLVLPPGGSYIAGRNLDFTASFNESVFVDTSGGTPYFTITMNHPVNVVYLSGSGTKSLLFRYTVQPGDYTNSGFTIGASMDLNGGTIRDLGNNDPILQFGAYNTIGIIVDTIPPMVASVSVPAVGAYKEGSNLDFTVIFAEFVNVTTAGGVPYLPIILDTGGTVRASYVSGNGRALLFRYKVQAGNSDPDGIVLGAEIIPNGGTLKDTPGNGALLVLNNVGDTSGVRIDTAPPSLVDASRTDNTHLVVTFNEDCLNLNQANDGGFILVETSPRSLIYPVLATAQGASASEIILTVPNLDASAKYGLMVKYTAAGNGIIRDPAGNLLATNDPGVSVPAWSENRPPQLTTPGPFSVDEGQSIRFTLTGTDPDRDSLTYTAGDLPNGAVFNPATAEFSWTPSYKDSGIYSWQFTVSDGEKTDTQTVTVTVNDLGTLVWVLLLDSHGNGIAGGQVSYAGNSWQTIGVTGSDGKLAFLLPSTTSIITVRMTYQGMSRDLAQNIIYAPDFSFATVNANVSFQDSAGDGVSGGMITYAGSSWLSFGTTDSSGAAAKELLPGSYKFRMTYGGASLDQTQSVAVNPQVNFRTQRVTVTLKDNAGNGIPNGVITYAGSSWLSFGTTDSSGVASKELLPVSYKFRMTYAGAALDQTQSVAVNPQVNFRTQPVTVTLKDSFGNGIAGGVVTYAGSSWLSFGTTDSTGTVSKELLPVSYKFRMTDTGASVDQTQDVTVNSQVNFETQPVTVALKDSLGNGISGAVVTYAGSSWLSFGTTDSNGMISKELLPVSYKFRMTYAGASVDQTQDVAINPMIGFQTRNVLITLEDSLGNGLAGGVAIYAGSSWLSFGTTNENGEIRKELLPASYTFRMTYAGRIQDQVQDVNENSLVEFQF